MQLSLYHLTHSRSQRILWLLEELNLPYQLKIYTQHILEHEDAELKQFNPEAKFPTLVMTDLLDQTTTVLTESSAIIEYLSFSTQKFAIQGLNQQEIIDFYFWKNFADSNFMPKLALKQIFYQLVQRTPFPIHILTRLLKHGFDRGFLNHTLAQQLQSIHLQLKNKAWIAGGSFTIADLLLWFPLKACFELHPRYQKFTEIQRYLLQIESKPAFQTALMKGQWSAETFKSYWSKADQ